VLHKQIIATSWKINWKNVGRLKFTQLFDYRLFLRLIRQARPLHSRINYITIYIYINIYSQQNRVPERFSWHRNRAIDVNVIGQIGQNDFNTNKHSIKANAQMQREYINNIVGFGIIYTFRILNNLSRGEKFISYIANRHRYWEK